MSAKRKHDPSDPPALAEEASPDGQATEATEAATAVAEPPPAGPDGFPEESRSLVTNAERLFAAAEAMLFKAEVEADLPSAFWPIARLLGWDSRQVTKEHQRCKRIQHWQSRAGNGEERAEAEQHLETLREENPPKLARIAEEIATLQKEAGALRGEEASAARTVQGHQEAVAALRDDWNLPDEILQHVAHERARINRRFAELKQAKSDLGSIQGLLDLERVSRHTANLFLGSSDMRRKFGITAAKPVPSAEHWEEYRRELMEERDRLQAIIDQQEPQRRELLVGLEKLRDRYIPA